MVAEGWHLIIEISNKSQPMAIGSRPFPGLKLGTPLDLCTPPQVGNELGPGRTSVAKATENGDHLPRRLRGIQGGPAEWC